MSESASKEVGDLLIKIYHLLRVRRDDVLRESGLTTPQYAALATLSTEPGLSAAALARRCTVTPQTMAGIVANLLEAGLIAREPDPEHGRILKTSLMPQGVDILRRTGKAVRSVDEKMLAELDRAEREAFADLLAQCTRALEL